MGKTADFQGRSRGRLGMVMFGKGVRDRRFVRASSTSGGDPQRTNAFTPGTYPKCDP